MVQDVWRLALEETLPRSGGDWKWLRIHRTMEWVDSNDEAHQHDLLRFFDHYLSGKDNDWLSTPQVRYSLLDLEGNDRVDIPADTFPPPGFGSVRYYLDGGSQALSYPVAVTRCRQSSGCR